MARGPRDRTQTLHHAHGAHEHRSDRGGALRRGPAGPVARLPRQRGAARAARRDFPAQHHVQPRVERLGVPQVVQLPQNLRGLHLRGRTHGRSSGTRGLRIYHRGGVARDELAALRLRAGDQSPALRSRRSGGFPRRADPEQHHPQERAADPLVRSHRRTRGAVPPQGPSGALQRGGIRHVVHLQPVAAGRDDRPPGPRRQTRDLHPLAAPRHAAARRDAQGARKKHVAETPFRAPLLRFALQLPPALSARVRPFPARQRRGDRPAAPSDARQRLRQLDPLHGLFPRADH